MFRMRRATAACVGPKPAAPLSVTMPVRLFASSAWTMTSPNENASRLNCVTRERQQAAVAGLGQFALGGVSLPAVMDRAVHVLTDALDIEFAKVLELRPDGQDLLLRAGGGSMPGFRIGETVIYPAERRSQAGFTLSRLMQGRLLSRTWQPRRGLMDCRCCVRWGSSAA